MGSHRGGSVRRGGLGYAPLPLAPVASRDARGPHDLCRVAVPSGSGGSGGGGGDAAANSPLTRLPLRSLRRSSSRVLSLHGHRQLQIPWELRPTMRPGTPRP
ncbi:unnamed protein product [Lampetra fluviatilis]